MKGVTFLNPEFFWLFLLLPLPILWEIWKRNKKQSHLTISTLKGLEHTAHWLGQFRYILIVLRIGALSLLIVALARPQKVDISNKTKTTKGIDIVMAIDVSASMLAKDLKPNRIEALKKVAAEFVQARTNDRIGVVVYAAESYTRTPVTVDKTIVQEALRTIKYDNVLKDGTGIGMGLATSINRLKDSKAKSKVIILLTDGVNNSGFLEPGSAAELAKEYGIKVYTIGIGTNGVAEFPYALTPTGEMLFRPMQVEIDEALMRNIAKITDGKYFRATDNKKLREIYNEINKLETTEIEELKYFHYDEKFRLLALPALLLLLVELILKYTVFRSFV